MPISLFFPQQKGGFKSNVPIKIEDMKFVNIAYSKG